jgi:hypothetical protein
MDDNTKYAIAIAGTLLSVAVMTGQAFAYVGGGMDQNCLIVGCTVSGFASSSGGGRAWGNETAVSPPQNPEPYT